MLGATASKSISNVGEFLLAKLKARLIAVVVLPGDPFIPQTLISPGICVNSSSPELNLSISVMFDKCENRGFKDLLLSDALIAKLVKTPIFLVSPHFPNHLVGKYHKYRNLISLP